MAKGAMSERKRNEKKKKKMFFKLIYSLQMVNWIYDTWNFNGSFATVSIHVDSRIIQNSKFNAANLATNKNRAKR